MYRLHKVELAVIIRNQKDKKIKKRETNDFDCCVNASLGTQQVEVLYDIIALISYLMIKCIFWRSLIKYFWRWMSVFDDQVDFFGSLSLN